MASTKLNINDKVHVATLNMRGGNDTGKRTLIDKWAYRYKIVCISLEETKINVNIVLEMVINQMVKKYVKRAKVKE